MSSTKQQHTPGPWEVCPKCPPTVHDRTGNTIAVLSYSETEPTPNAEANARLIASAPALLETIVALLEIGQFQDDCGPEGEGWRSKELRSAIAAVEAAITSATG